MDRIRGIFLLFFCLGCLCFFSINAKAQTTFEVAGYCEVSPKATIRIRVDEASKYSGFDIYRADDNGIYWYIGYVGIGQSDDSSDESGLDYTNDEYETSWVYEDDKSVEYRKYVFYDPTDLVISKSYSYKVVGYQYSNGVKNEINTAYTNVTILSPGPTIISGKRNGKLGSVINWSLVPDADGYIVYCAENYDEKSNFIDIDYYSPENYSELEIIENAYVLSASYDNLRNGVTYTYRVCSYKNVNGSRVLSVMSEIMPVTMDYYTYFGESYNNKVKRAFGSEKKKNKNFKTSAKAFKQMKTIKVKLWDFKNGKKGKKVTRIRTITVNKRLAPSIQRMFEELYQSEERQVVHDIGCYSYRSGEHMYGMAIDFNANENYMIDGGKILAGSFWKPGKNAYSIPADCEFVRIMARYGFLRGAWGNRKDYMHFSYFGT